MKGVIKIIFYKNHRIFICLFFLLFLQGCVSGAKQINIEQIDKIEIGKTTKTDILTIFGLPNEREVKSIRNDKNIEFWTYLKGTGDRILLIPIAGDISKKKQHAPNINFSNVHLSNHNNIVAILAFDENGVLVDLKKGEDSNDD